MDKNFVPFKEAIALKGLGFDEPCVAFYPGIDGPPVFNYAKDLVNGDYRIYMSRMVLDWALAPMFQQAFSFLREFYDLYSIIEYEFSDKKWSFKVFNLSSNENPMCVDRFCGSSFEEAELFSLKKLIFIAKALPKREFKPRNHKELNKKMN